MFFLWLNVQSFSNFNLIKINLIQNDKKNKSYLAGIELGYPRLPVSSADHSATQPFNFQLIL